jgi:hypothetical protein
MIQISIGLQQMWGELKKKGKNPDSLAFDFNFEERTWQMISMLDKFNINRISSKVERKLKMRPVDEEQKK